MQDILLDLENVNIDDPILIGYERENIGVPNWDIITMILSDYIKSNDPKIKTELTKILNIYINHGLNGADFENSIDNMIESIIIRAIITPEEIPTYKEVVKTINNDLLKNYLNITSKTAPIESLRSFISLSIYRTAFILYAIYNIEEFNDYTDQVKKLMDKRFKYVNDYKKSTNIDDKLEIQKEATEFEGTKKQDTLIEEYRENTYQLYETEKAIDHILEVLLKELFPNYEGMKTVEEQIERLNSIRAINYIIPNTKVMNALSQGKLLPGDTDIMVSSRLKKEVITKFTLNYDDDNIEIFDKDKRFTPYDRAVHNAVVSIREAGNVNFTPNQVYRCMNGLSEGEYVSPQAIGSITRSIDKTRRILVKINYSNEAKAWRKDIDNCIVEDYILSAKKVILEAGGNEVIGYRIHSKPILYEYAQVTGQVLTIPNSLLNTKGILNSTPEVAVITEYLIRRIEVMKSKNNKSQSNKILLTTIYEEIEIMDPTKEKAKKIRDTITKLLDNFQDKKYIKSYEFYKEGRAFKGIEILY